MDLLVPEILYEFFKSLKFIPEPADSILKTIIPILEPAYSILEPGEPSLKAYSGSSWTLLIYTAFNYSILRLNNRLSL
jgi:hypothetical protein